MIRSTRLNAAASWAARCAARNRATFSAGVSFGCPEEGGAFRAGPGDDDGIFDDGDEALKDGEDRGIW